MNTSSILNSYFSCLNKPLPSFDTIAKGVEAVNSLLQQEILCPHDINQLSKAYKQLDNLALQATAVPEADLVSILDTVAEKMKVIHTESSSAKQIITAYHLRKFEISVMNKTFTPHFSRPQSIGGKIKDIATHLHVCCKKDNFEVDVRALLGEELDKDIKDIIEDKKDQICKRHQIKERVKKLEQLRKENASLYPPYLEDILDEGCFHLYDHLIEMKKIPTQEVQKELAVSVFSHIILEFKKITLAKTDKLIPPESKTLFLIGATGSGKSTTLCYFRKDSLILKGDRYELSDSSKNIIGHDDTTSYTLFPNVAICQDFAVIDFPGFDDTHGKVITLAIEISLRALIKRYSPRILVLFPISDNEIKFKTSIVLGETLKRILGKLNHCTLGLTKYSRNLEFIKIKNIEIQQYEQLNHPSSEESKLQGGIETLQFFLAENPDLQARINQKQEELFKLEQERTLLLKSPLPNTDQKKEYANKIIEIEGRIKERIGINEVIFLKDLTDHTQLEQFFNAFKTSQEISVISNKYHLSPESKELLAPFQDQISDLINSQQDHSFSSPAFNSLPQTVSESELISKIEEFKSNILKTSLINTLLYGSFPEVGQFFHLEEMDPDIIRGYDKAIIKNAIKGYIDQVISDISVIEEIIKEFVKKSETELGKNSDSVVDDTFKSLKNYILSVHEGTPNQVDKAKVDEKWDLLQEKIHKEKSNLKISRSMHVAFSLALGIPYAIFALFKKIKMNKIYTKSMEDIAKMLCDYMQEVSQAVQLFKQIEDAVLNKDCTHQAILDRSLSPEINFSLEIPLNQ
ncbi:MAG: hypothetical protein QRY72_00625 [Candidatus Rhabdochlamydia sp.]